MAIYYTYEVSHHGLGKHRVLTGNDKVLLERKARALSLTWDDEYQRKQAKEDQKRTKEEERLKHIRSREAQLNEKERSKEMRARAIEQNQEKAADLTQAAQEDIEEVHALLRTAVGLKHTIDWNKLKNTKPFSKPKPGSPAYIEYPPEPQATDSRYVLTGTRIREPQPTDPKYQPVLTFFDKLSKSHADQKIQAAHELYLQDHADWMAQMRQIEAALKQQAQDLFLRDHTSWRNTIPAVEAENKRRYDEGVEAVREWELERAGYEKKQYDENAPIDKLKTDYESSVPAAIANYCEFVLSASKYPDGFPQESNLDYIAESKILVIDYSLPAPEHMPTTKEVKYVKAKDELVTVSISQSELNRLYDDALYQICLRTIYELFDADQIGALSAIVFNGWVKSIDRATGKETNGCLISVQAKKEEFAEVNLANVDAKACFKSLKGVGSSQLHSLTPVAPVLRISREDKRFIASKEVAGLLDERFNLAAMDWEDFEQLVRELFEKEFNKSGGEVRVTQASRDGGVDAVAFDPDPIHGGKIVIQAKRYTNTVGVGFVRELWGTVLNEGAMKGILITTADYGSDAYEFAKGKPITLMSGANLLYLLEKHGHKAKIDIQEAKRILGENMR